MGEWKECKLGNIAVFNYGKGLKAENRIEGNIPVYSSAGLTGYHNEALVNSNGIIVGRKGTVGKVYYSKSPFFCIDTAYFITPDENKYTLDFLYYLLQTLGLEDLNEDSAVPGLNRNTAYNQDIRLPPLPEQKAIASVLSSLDDKIDLLHRQNKTLEAMAETLFRQWFVEEVQEDWEERPLGELVTISSSKRIFYKEYVPRGVPFYRSKEIIELTKGGDTSTELFISEDRFNEIDSKFGSPRESDILLTSVGTLGISYRVKRNDKFYFKDGNLIWFKDFKELSSTIIYCWLNSDIGKEELNNITIGSTQAALTISGLKQIDLKIPPKEIQNKLDEELITIYKKIDFNQTQIRTLQNLRDTLLPKLMSGEVRVEYES